MKYRVFIQFFLVCTLLSNLNLHAQMLKDKDTIKLIEKDINYIYNMEFGKAHSLLELIEKSYPDHPVTYLLKGMIIYWENFPLLSTSPFRVSYENELRKCIELCEKKASSENDPEYLLSNLSARGMLLLFYSDNAMTSDVIRLGTTTYHYIRKAFKFTDSYSDFCFFTGLYNYYREAYPEAYPIYRTFAFLFPKGNRYKGLEELQLATSNSLVLKAESSSFLTHIYISFETDYQKAFEYSDELHRLYPGNFQYTANYIKNLLLIKKYDEAWRQIRDSETRFNNDYFQSQLLIFKGIIQEKKFHDQVKSKTYYSDGIRNISGYGNYSDEYVAYALFGISRIDEKEGNLQLSNNIRKKAENLAVYKSVNFD